METNTKTISIPQRGLDAKDILEQLTAMKSNDVPWDSGKVLAYVYEPKKETETLTKEAYKMYLIENGLDPTAFPSLLRLENELIGMAKDLLGGDDEVVGNFTSGGTESIILAVKTARDYFRTHRPEIKEPELIVGETAHAAFHKAGHYLGVKIVMVPVDKKTFKVDPELVKNAITENTILIVGSAPSYAHGVIDPIEALAALAKAKGILCHVDACVGGFYLPFAKMAGYDMPLFDFRVDGVTSMSADFHKYGYAAKGASCILHKSRDLRRHQIFACSSWSGYTIINPTVLSSKTGGPLAGAWATLNHIGQEGYIDIVKGCQEAAQLCRAGIEKIPELEVMGDPDINLIAIASTDPRVNIFAISDWMTKRGWHIQVQLASNCAKEALHLSINRANVPFIAELLEDLKIAIEELKQKDAPEMALDPAMFAPMLENMNAETFDNLAGMLGLGGGGEGAGLPDDLEMINNILNQLPAKQRNVLLTEFMNKLFTQ
ncbi:pyridoxal phosphate-dependent decarboxylase family protein [Aureispira anguillae]|uniref:Aspartate aminotransferase family protein n=1 Tax=Aureispira anguillae TaxID=2864201 RepID=A0A915YDD2_9BACT|nr:aspartate aminotransferase family protein [Aureispira anguillae]BDS11024.1 aspartate aminotransferase family protein [Aureispira anguillae]